MKIKPAGRSRVLGVLVAVCVAVGLVAVPGAAAAATAQVAPFVDCYRQNANGTYTVVFGYTNTNRSTTTIAYGSSNTIYPSKYHGTQPRTFQVGTYRGVFSVTVAEADALAFRWQLDRTTLNYSSAASAPTCSASTPLPALGNGTGLAIALLAGGVFGVFFVRRIIRRAAARS